MKYLNVIKSVLFSLFLIIIYWDSTLWKFSVGFLGKGELRISYGLLSIAILLGISILYLSLFSFITLTPKKKKKRKKKDNTIAYILVGIFCFKFAIFGDLSINIDTQTDPNSFTQIDSYHVNKKSLKVYDIGQVKGNGGFHDIYKGFYFITDNQNKNRYLICSKTVSGPSVDLDILNEATKHPLKIYVNENIKPSQKEEIDAYFQLNNLQADTNIHSIQTSGFVLFFMRLLYWGVFMLVIIGCFFYITWSL